MIGALSDIDLALIDAQTLIKLSDLRKHNPRGFHDLSRAMSRIVRRVINGRAAQCVNSGSADLVIFALVYGLRDHDDTSATSASTLCQMARLTIPPTAISLQARCSRCSCTELNHESIAR